MRFLAASDIHLGRIPALPDPAVAATGRGAWEAVVQCALDRQVDALLLAGDVVEQDNAWFEAYGALKKGLDRLGAAGIRVVAVAGNHDAQIFPRLAQECPGLTLLGRGGQWQAARLGGLCVVGWSFPARTHSGNPMASFPEAALAEGAPYLGLLHCDLDASPGSPYAPVPARDLDATGARLWVLGHIHKGGPQAGGRAIYCGSAFALDAREEGCHGAWAFTADEAGRVSAPEPVPLSPWEFATLPVDLEGAGGREDVETRIAAAFQAAAADTARTARLLFASLRLTGACEGSGTLEDALRDPLASLQVEQGGVAVRPSLRIQDATRPRLDLPALALGRGVKAALARLLIQAEDPSAPVEVLPGVLDQVRAQLAPRSETEAREWLSLAARRLLGAVLEQEREA